VPVKNKRTVAELLKREGFKKFMVLCKKFKYLYIIVLLLQLSGTGVSILLAETSRRLIDTRQSTDRSQLIALILALLIFVILSLIISYFAQICNQIVNTNIVFQMRQMVLNQLMRLSLSYHEGKHSSQANNLLFNELEVFKQFVVFDVIRLISLPFSFVAIGIYLMSVNHVLGIISICMGPLQLLSNLVIKESFKDLVAKQQVLGGEAFYNMGEAMAGIREIKMNQLENSIILKFRKVCEDGIRLWVSIEKMEAFRELIRLLPEKLGYLIGMGVGAILMANGEIGPGALVAFISLLDRANEPFASIVKIVSSLQKVSSGAERLLDLMELEPENSKQGLELLSEPATIQFDQVTFAYEEGHSVLKNVTFTVPAGMTVALVGPSGGGKSTIVKLLYRFYTPLEGGIRINGELIEKYSIDSLRKNMSAVTQDVYLFDDTIANNIAIGRADADEQDIYRATVLSQSNSFIEKLPEKFNTRVGERGIKLSQGQKQRVAISRVILRNPSILILDEPTSALDVETEAMFQKDLDKWAGASTKIIIAHRLSTIRKADFVAFLEDGEIREFGSPKELLAKGGRFLDFWGKQEIVEFAL
jgi:ABC-type multidrug transport system fused ATPase/permease subunit